MAKRYKYYLRSIDVHAPEADDEDPNDSESADVSIFEASPGDVRQGKSPDRILASGETLKEYVTRVGASAAAIASIGANLLEHQGVDIGGVTVHPSEYETQWEPDPDEVDYSVYIQVFRGPVRLFQLHLVFDRE